MPTVRSTVRFSCSNESGPPPLHQAVKKDNIEFATRLAELCKEHLNLKYVYDFRLDETPLSLAIKGHSPEMVRMLINSGADPNTVTQLAFRHYETPLSLAVKARSAELVRIPSGRGGRPLQRDPVRLPPLLKSARDCIRGRLHRDLQLSSRSARLLSLSRSVSCGIQLNPGDECSSGRFSIRTRDEGVVVLDGDIGGISLDKTVMKEQSTNLNSFSASRGRLT